MAYFELTGANPIDPSDYTLRTSLPGCGGVDQICAVQATNNGNDEPILTAALKDEMITALHTGDESTNVKLRNR